jgi:hypothetical protein
MKEAPGSSETSVLTRATRRNIPEDTILRGYVSKPYAPAAALLSTNIFLHLAFISVRLSKLQDLVRPERLGKLITIVYLIGAGTRNLPTCSIAIVET